MVVLRFCFAAAVLLGACTQTPDISDSAVSIGQRIEAEVEIVGGDVLAEGRGPIEYRGHNWSIGEDRRTLRRHSLFPPPGFVAGPTCIFARTDSDGIPQL